MCIRSTRCPRILWVICSGDYASDASILRSFIAYSGSGVSQSGAPVWLNGVVACNITLLDRDTDLSRLAIPLLPLPDGLLLVQVTASDQPSTSIENPLPREQLPHVASPPRDLSREGPFDAYCAPSAPGISL